MHDYRIAKNLGQLVAVITITGYAFAFCYEFGYLGYYDIHADFVRVTHLQIFFGAIVALVSIIVLDIIYSLVAAVIDRYGENDPIYRARVEFSTVTLLFMMALFFILVRTTEGSDRLIACIFAVAIYALVLGLLFIRPVIDFFKMKDWKKALALHYENVDSQRKKDDYKDKVAVSGNFKVIPHIWRPGLVLVIMFIACGIFGRISAGYEDRYVTVLNSANPNKEIVVRYYDGKLLLKTYNAGAQALEQGFSIKNSEDRGYSNEVLKCTAVFKKNENSDPNVKAKCPEFIKRRIEK